MSESKVWIIDQNLFLIGRKTETKKPILNQFSNCARGYKTQHTIQTYSLIHRDLPSRNKRYVVGLKWARNIVTKSWTGWIRCWEIPVWRTLGHYDVKSQNYNNNSLYFHQFFIILLSLWNHFCVINFAAIHICFISKIEFERKSAKDFFKKSF